MTDIIKNLPVEDQQALIDNMFTELDSIKTGDNLTDKIHDRIAELNATNILLISTESELKELKLTVEIKQLQLKNSDEYITNFKTLKEREENAILETEEQQHQILSLDKKVKILQANKQGLEYELRLLYKQYELEGSI